MHYADCSRSGPSLKRTEKKLALSPNGTSFRANWESIKLKINYHIRMCEIETDWIETPAGNSKFQETNENEHIKLLSDLRWIIMMVMFDCFFFSLLLLLLFLLRFTINHLAQSGEFFSASSYSDLWNFNLYKMRQHSFRPNLRGKSNFRISTWELSFPFFKIKYWNWLYKLCHCCEEEQRVKAKKKYIYMKEYQFSKASQTKGMAAGQGLIVASI